MASTVIDCSGIEIRDEHVVALNSLLRGEPGAWEPFRIAESEAEAIAYTVILYAAFHIAVRRKFSPNYTNSAVIRFVADMRLAYGQDVSPIHPGVAEGMIREALGDPSIESFEPQDAEAAMEAEAAILDTLLDEANFDEGELEEFIRVSALFAREWVAARQG